MQAIRTYRAVIRAAIELALVSVLVALISWAGIVLTREGGRVATIWLANGFIVGLLLRVPKNLWGNFIAAGFLGNVAANVLAGDTVSVGLMLSFCNTLEVCIAAWPLQRLIGDRPDMIKIAAAARRMVVWVIAAPVLPSVLGAATVMLAADGAFWGVLKIWYPADLLGISIVTPFVLALNKRVANRLFARDRYRETLLSIALLVVTTVGVFLQDGLPLLFLVYPPLLFVVFRQGMAGAALGLIVVSAIAIAFTIKGHGPFMLAHAVSMPERILLLQFYVAVASLTAYPVGVVLTERSHLQSTLAESERRYRTLSENSSDIIVRATVDGKRLYISPSVTEVLGYTADELLGDAREDLIHPDDRDLFLRSERDLLSEKSLHAGEREITLVYRYLHKRGDYIWLEMRGRIVRSDRPGEPDEVIKIIRDISGQKQVAEALAKSERDLRAVADNLPALVSFVDADGVMQFCNATHQIWFGRSGGELVGHHLSEILGVQAYDDQHSYLSRALYGEGVEFELRLACADGMRDTRFSYVPRYSADGVITGVYVLVMDTTATKVVERELVRLARFDTLTGLPNRYQFNQRLEQELAFARRARAPMALLFVDVDSFKAINDTFGHGVGDEVLQEAARRMQSCVRACDIVARLAGDEFVVVLREPKTPQAAEVVADKILGAIDRPFFVASGTVKVTVSIGIAYVRDGSPDAAEVLRNADAALYASKAAGRNTYRSVLCSMVA